jgi:hypothetical protein
MNAKENKYLKVNSNVVLNPLIEKVVCELDKHFEKANIKAVVTSGVRTPDDQLRIIRQYLVSTKLAVKYPEALTGEVTDKLPNGDYNWQMGWSALLNSGFIINPPFKAKLLMNYFNAQGVNRINAEFNQTAHASGVCVDLGGGGNGLNDEIAVVTEAKKEIPEIVSLVIERNNNCLHLNLKSI